MISLPTQISRASIPFKEPGAARLNPKRAIVAKIAESFMFGYDE